MGIPVLKHCFIRKAIREMNYLGHQWVIGKTKKNVE